MAKARNKSAGQANRKLPDYFVHETSIVDEGASIGEGTKIDNLVQIAHNVVIGRHCILVAQCGVSGSTVVGDFAALGGQAGLTVRDSRWRPADWPGAIDSGRASNNREVSGPG